VGRKLKSDMLTTISDGLGSTNGTEYLQKQLSCSRYKKQGFESQEDADNAEKWVLEELESCGNILIKKWFTPLAHPLR
jgi:hypothetical protein